MTGFKTSVKADPTKMYSCPECRGRTRQFCPETVGPGRPLKTMNTVRVDHHLDCARWNFIVRTWPRLVGMRQVATPVS